MDFEFSEEQVAIRDTIRELVQDRVAPRAAEIDETAEYPKDIEKLFAENGILGIPFPEEYGGISGSSVTICMGIEEIAKACATSSLILAVQALGSYPILVAGSEEQKKRLCPPLASGEKVAAYALSETGQRVRRRRDEDARQALRRRVRAQRHQAVHHARQRRGHARRLRADRSRQRPPRHLGLRARARDEPLDWRRSSSTSSASADRPPRRSSSRT